MSDKDTIYRQDAIEAIMSEPPDAHYPSWYADILWKLPSADPCVTATSNTMVSGTVKIPVMDGTTERLQSAQPERKKGKWIQIDAGYFDYVKCSQCGETLDWEKNFCPNCGADMKEGEEE